jgi:hypothetical protein
MSMTADEQRRWLEQWRRAGVALARQRRAELRALSHRDALAASEALLGLVSAVAIPAHRLRGSGLIEQQALFHRRRPR